jgi:hypothetical protein
VIQRINGKRFLSHKPLAAASAASLIGAVVATFFYFTDSRELLGVPVWEKPLKFLISSAIYTATFSWLYGYAEKAKRLAWWMGNAIAALLVIELAIIIGMAAAGTTSHFNVSSPFHIAMWSVMATAISMVWGATFILGASLWNSSLMAKEIRLAVRWALGLGLAGMGIAFTMTPPQPQQITPDNWAGIAGAHTVGAADGGPGLPFFGWSTVAGDLRVSHFLGLHALQVLPIVALLVTALVSTYALRVAIVTGTSVGYALLIVFTYVQALLGVSVLSFSSLIGLFAVVITSLSIALLSGVRSQTQVHEKQNR